MAIYVNKEQHLFHLQAGDTSYLIQIIDGYPVHTYWGRRLRADGNLEGLAPFADKAFLDTTPQEYPQYGSGDFRSPAYQVQLEDGSRITELRYKGYEIIAGKPALKGLPSVYTESSDEADTLELELEDSYTGLSVLLRYTIFSGGAITRSVQIANNGSGTLKLLRVRLAPAQGARRRRDRDDAVRLRGLRAGRHAGRRPRSAGAGGGGRPARTGAPRAPRDGARRLARPSACGARGRPVCTR